jgi:pyruvate/2-oxoacid:ferredoxin oxidoreductase beta subunit
MDKFSLYVPNFLPCREYFKPDNNNACPGCGLALAVRHTYKAVEKIIEKAVWELPAEGDLFGEKTNASILKIRHEKKEIIICFDNEAGGDLNGAIKKQMPAIAVAQGFNYVATACPSYPFDLYDKMKKAMGTEGRSCIHILCPCPVGWQFDAENTVKVGFMAVESCAFPLYEVSGGDYALTVKIPKQRKLIDYIRAQGRFSSIAESETEAAGAAVEKEYTKLLKIIESGYSYTFETTGKVY